MTVLGDQHDILNADAAPVGDVDARLDGGDHARLERFGLWRLVAPADRRPLVDVEADAVALKQSPCRRRRCSRGQRPLRAQECPGGCRRSPFFRFQDDVVDRPTVARQDNGAREVGVVTVDERPCRSRSCDLLPKARHQGDDEGRAALVEAPTMWRRRCWAPRSRMAFSIIQAASDSV